MSKLVRHLSPLIRSRRRIPFVVFSIIFLVFFSLSYLFNRTTEPYRRHDESTKFITRNRIVSIGTSSMKNEKLKTNYLVLDWTGFFGGGATDGEQVQCPSSQTTFTWTRQQNRFEQADFIISHDAQAGSGIPFSKLKLDEHQQQYTMAFIMESEVHSSTGDAWKNFHFKMSYNLDDSYPEPATYFDMNEYLVDLLRPSTISFAEKEKSADVVWIISNCNAHNGRQTFIQALMKEMSIHSYGACLNNRQGYSARMTDNINAYKNYKFVIAIENSNCRDYVTEKLVKAVASGSIPIVAGRDGRPDYRRYLPDHSYINIFDYSSIKSLADDLKRIANNETLYQSYLWYKKHSKDIKTFEKLPLEKKLSEIAEVIGSNSTMLTEGIAAKEKSENKVCKLIRFVRQTPWQDIARHNRTARADAGIACLPGGHILPYFQSSHQNRTEP